MTKCETEFEKWCKNAKPTGTNLIILRQEIITAHQKLCKPEKPLCKCGHKYTAHARVEDLSCDEEIYTKKEGETFVEICPCNKYKESKPEYACKNCGKSRLHHEMNVPYCDKNKDTDYQTIYENNQIIYESNSEKPCKNCGISTPHRTEKCSNPEGYKGSNTDESDKPFHLVYFDMMHCDRCAQMTNHRNGVCQKCEPEKPEEA